MSLVLIIEDEPTTAVSVKEALEIDGIQADIANNGIKGLELFREKEYNLILIDLKLPILSGAEVLGAIRKKNPFVPVIVHSNYSDMVNIRKLTDIGIDGCVMKGPEADLDELVNIVKSKLAPPTLKFPLKGVFVR